MAKCPLARVGGKDDCKCWEDECKWWGKIAGGGGDCYILTIMQTLDSYVKTLHVYQAEKMSGPVDDFGIR